MHGSARRLTIVLILGAVLAGAADVDAASGNEAILAVVPDPASPTAGIQEALDRVRGSGGLVQIPPGVFVLRRPVIVTDRTIIRGSGAATVLRPDPEYESPLSADAMEGEKTIRVVEPGRFRVGDAVCVVSDEHHAGYSAAFGIVESIEGEVLGLDLSKGPFRKPYRVAQGARAIHAFCVFRSPRKGFQGAEQHHVRDLAIRDLAIEGSPETCGYSNWYINGGLYLAGDGITLENLVIRNTPADGIVLSLSGRYIVRNNFLSNIKGRGIHFGDNAEQIIISHNIIENVSDMGIFFCWGGQRVIVTHNIITGAGYAGIGGIGAGGNRDRYANVSHNIIRDSGRYGIHFQRDRDPRERPGRFINVNGNTLHRIKETGIHLASAQHVSIVGNVISEAGTGIEIRGSVGCQVSSNLIHGSGCGIRLTRAAGGDAAGAPSRDNLVRGNSVFDTDEAIANDLPPSWNTVEANLVTRTRDAGSSGRSGRSGED